MPVTDDLVVSAYRLILGREPENEQVVKANSQAPNWQELRRAFLMSEEFRRHSGEGVVVGSPIGQFMNVRKNEVEVACTPEQLQQMFDGIAANWKMFGETEPHWSVLTNPVFYKESLPEHLDDFFAHGKMDVEHALNFLSRADLPATNFERVMDFGCGVGRLTVALAPHARTVVGVDISPSHLREAEKTVAAKSVTNCEFKQIHTVEGIKDLGTYDLIISRIVLQHNPPPIIAAIYRQLLNALRPGGAAIIQIPTYMRGQKFKVADYLASKAPDMEMNALPQHEIFRIIHETGCLPIEVRETDDIGPLGGLSHTFAVRRPETA